MKNLFFAFFTALLLTACQTKTDKINDFVNIYNRSSSMMISHTIKSTKAVASGDNEITIEVNTSSQPEDEIETQLIKSSLPELIGQAIKSEPKGQELLDSGVKFNLKIYGKDARVIADETVDKNSLKGNAAKELRSIAQGNTGASQLNTVLEVFNKNLPMEDKSTGTKIMSIKADEENNIVYTAEVPDSYKEMLQMEGAEQILKDEMLRSPQVQQIFTKTAALGVNNLKYKYTDSKGNTIKEITITKADVK